MALPLSKFIQNITKASIRKNGFATAQIIFDWQLIVGDYLAKYTTPLKISYPSNKTTDGTLHIQVIGAQAPIIQQLEPQIIEKISVYFGFKAVGKIKLVHTKEIPDDFAYNTTSKLSPAELEELDKMVSEVEDEDLKKLLLKIGKRIVEKKNDK